MSYLVLGLNAENDVILRLQAFTVAFICCMHTCQLLFAMHQMLMLVVGVS